MTGEIAATKFFHTSIDEAKVAAGHDLGSWDERVKLGFDLLTEEYREVLAADTPAELAKELADLIFVVLQLAHFYSIPMEQVYAEVLRSNFSKLDGGATFRDDGKLLKGRRYSPANVSDVMERCGWGR